MNVTAAATRPGDRIRGIGLVVEYSEPEADYTTAIEGYVLTPMPTLEGNSAEFEKTPVKLVLPNTHRVNVVRPFQVGDKVTVADPEGMEYEDVSYVEAVVLHVYEDLRTITVGYENDLENPWGVGFRAARHVA